MATKIFDKSEYDLRIRRAKELMKRDGLDAIIATHPKNFEYFSAGWRLDYDPFGYMIDQVPSSARPGMMIVPVGKDPVALIPSLYEVGKQRGWVDNVKTWHGLPFKADYLRNQLTEIGIQSGKIGMELGEELRLDIPYVEFVRLRTQIPTVEFVPSSIFWELRTVKSEAEAAKMRTACRITGKAFEKFFSVARSGMSVKEVIRRLYNCYMDAGALRPAFPPWLGVSPWQTGGRFDLGVKTLRKGRIYCFDTSAIFDDYTADLTRMAVVGRPSQHQKDMYEATVKINDAVRKKVRSGAKTKELWDVCNETMKELRVSWGETEPDRIGHGLGLMGTEPPSLGPSDPSRLAAGNVVCIEPGIGGADDHYYIEEDVWVTESGSELLSRSVSRQLWQVRT